MRINLLSSFASGILIATTICGIAYFTDNSDVSKASSHASEPQKTAQLTEKEMKKKLETTGFVVQTKDEYDKNLKAAKPADKKQASSEVKDSPKTVTKLIVNVSEGMTSIDVGNMLVKANIIPNAYNFSSDIEKKGLQNKLRPGVFVVDSEMSYDQVIATIFK